MDALTAAAIRGDLAGLMREAKRRGVYSYYVPPECLADLGAEVLRIVQESVVAADVDLCRDVIALLGQQCSWYPGRHLYAGPYRIETYGSHTLFVYLHPAPRHGDSLVGRLEATPSGWATWRNGVVREGKTLAEARAAQAESRRAVEA